MKKSRDLKNTYSLATLKGLNKLEDVLSKNRIIKTNTFRKTEFRLLSDLKNSVYKTINYQALNNKNKDKKIPILITKKQLDKLFNRKTISKSKLKKYSFHKAYKKTFSFLEKNTKLEPSEIKKLSARISHAALLKTQQKLIFDGWEFNDNKRIIQNYKNILKINQIIENNSFDIFKNTKLITDINGRKYTFRELISPKKNYVQKIRNILNSIDANLLSYFATKRNLLKIEKVLTKRFINEKSEINTFKFDFSTIDFRQNKEQILQEINQIEAIYYDKTGKSNSESTRFFLITTEYIDSGISIITAIKIKSEYAINELVEVIIQNKQLAYSILHDDLTHYEGLAETLIDMLEGNYNSGFKHIGQEFDVFKKDLIYIINILRIKIATLNHERKKDK